MRESWITLGIRDNIRPKPSFGVAGDCSFCPAIRYIRYAGPAQGFEAIARWMHALAPPVCR